MLKNEHSVTKFTLKIFVGSPLGTNPNKKISHIYLSCTGVDIINNY